MRRRGAVDAKWKVVDGAMEIVDSTSHLISRDKFGDCPLPAESVAAIHFGNCHILPKRASSLTAFLGGFTFFRIVVSCSSGERRKEEVMRNIFAKSTILAAAGLALFAMSVPAYAQDRVMRIEIPFSFLAGEQRLPAGTYWVRFDAGFHTVDLTPLTSTETHRIRVHDGFTERKISGNHRGVLSFLKYGSNLVLKGVYAPGALQRHDLQTSRAEIELAKATAPAAAGEATSNLQ